MDRRGHVSDKFHIAKKVNECLSIRKREFRNAGKDVKKDFKDKRFLILSREENVPEDKKETLDRLLKQNQTLFKAYLLKEQVLDIFDGLNMDFAMDRLKRWKENVTASSIPEFQPLIKLLDSHLYGIKAYFKHRITNAGSEGFNNKINLIKRRAYGFRDIEYFMLKILKYAGNHHPKNAEELEYFLIMATSSGWCRRRYM